MDNKSEPPKRPRIIRPPQSHRELARLADRALKDAGTDGKLPTDLDGVLETTGVSLINDTDARRESFIASLPGRLKDAARSLFTKLKGVADLREKAVWIPEDDRPQISTFPKAHEASHQIIPWHRTKLGYLDTPETLAPEVEAEFEREANFMAAELIFQGDRFRKRALDYKASLETVFTLADNHLATYQSTIWKYVEVQDEAIAVAQYYPKLHDAYDEPVVFELWCTIGSDSFLKKCKDIELPYIIDSSSSSWPQAVKDGGICNGTCHLLCGSSKLRFTWESWWNRYTLFVLIRRQPALGFLGKAARRIQS